MAIFNSYVSLPQGIWLKLGAVMYGQLWTCFIRFFLLLPGSTCLAFLGLEPCNIESYQTCQLLGSMILMDSLRGKYSPEIDCPFSKSGVSDFNFPLNQSALTDVVLSLGSRHRNDACCEKPLAAGACRRSAIGT